MYSFIKKLLSFTFFALTSGASLYCMDDIQSLLTQKESLSTLISNNKDLPNFMFYGPSQINNTKAAQTLAQETGLEYHFLSLLDLCRSDLQTALAELANLFKKATQGTKKCMLILENPEAFLTPESPYFSEKVRSITTQFCAHTGRPSSRYMIVFITDNSRILHSAIDSRIDSKFYINA